MTPLYITRCLAGAFLALLAFALEGVASIADVAETGCLALMLKVLP